MRRTPRFRRPRTPVSWVTTVFNSSILSAGGTLTELVLLNGADWQGTTDSLTKVAHVKRVIANLAIHSQITDVTDYGYAQAAWLWACYVIDDNDADASITTTAAGSILQSNRVVATGVCGLDTFGYTTLSSGEPYSHYVITPQVNIDVRVGIKLRPEELLVCGVMLATGTGSTIVNGFASGYTRVLIREP